MTDDEKTPDGAAVKPQVIDLEAEDVTVEPEPPQPPPPPPVAPRRKWRARALWIAAPLLAGLLAGGWIYRDLLSSYLPSSQMDVMDARIAAMEINNKSLAGQLAALGQSAQSAADGIAALDKTVKTSAAALAATQTEAGRFESRIAAAEKTLAAAKSDLDGLRAAVSTAGAGNGTADAAALAAIGQRIDALEKDVASFKSAGGKTAGAAAATTLSQALADLKAKVAAGAPFKDEYERISRMVPAAAGLDAAGPLAEAGIANAAGLAAELRAAIPSLPKATAAVPATESGYWDSLVSGLSRIITIRDLGEADWPALAETCAGLAEAGDLTQAIDLIDQTEGGKPAPIVQWRDRAASRRKLEAALEQISQAVLRQIGAMGGTP